MYASVGYVTYNQRTTKCNVNDNVRQTNIKFLWQAETVSSSRGQSRQEWGSNEFVERGGGKELFTSGIVFVDGMRARDATFLDVSIEPSRLDSLCQSRRQTVLYARQIMITISYDLFSPDRYSSCFWSRLAFIFICFRLMLLIRTSVCPSVWAKLHVSN